jgi:hypothetical protein
VSWSSPHAALSTTTQTRLVMVAQWLFALSILEAYFVALNGTVRLQVLNGTFSKSESAVSKIDWWISRLWILRESRRPSIEQPGPTQLRGFTVEYRRNSTER